MHASSVVVVVVCSLKKDGSLRQLLISYFPPQPITKSPGPWGSPPAEAERIEVVGDLGW